MEPLSILLFAFAAVLFLMGIFIGKGNGEILKSYHAAKIDDKKKYDKHLGDCVKACALAPLAGGICGLFLGAGMAMVVMVVVLIIVLVMVAKSS